MLANRPRLRLLRELFRNPGLTVKEITRNTRLSEPIASRYLRALNSRGLLGVVRSGLLVRYHVEADPTVPDSDKLTDMLRDYLGPDMRSDQTEALFSACTGFTHPRRIEIVRALDRAPMRFSDLRRQTAFSTAALKRHLKKLTKRRIIRPSSKGYSLVRNRNTPCGVLIILACQ